MFESIKDTIESVDSVENCRIVDKDGIIEQIYVESDIAAKDDNERTQKIKGIVRSIIGAVAIQHNLELDYRKIKVIEYKENTNQSQDFHPRVQIISAYQRRYPVPESVVELYCFDQKYIGTAPLSEQNMGKSIFTAFANAFAQTELGTVSLIYMETLARGFDRDRLVLMKVKYSSPQADVDELFGVAELQEDLPLAVVKAVLNAINRRITVSIELPTRT